MKSSSLLWCFAWGVVVSCWIIWPCDGFAPTWSSSSSSANTRILTVPPIVRLLPVVLLQQSPNTLTEPERMTDQDEEILFGVSSSGQTANANGQHDLVERQRRKDKFGNILSDAATRRHLNPLDHAPNDPVINKLRTIRESLQSCPELWAQLAATCPDLRAVYDEHMGDSVIDQTFAQFSNTVQKSAAAFVQLGVQPGMNVAVLGENSAVWLMVDQGLQLAGGVTAVRGADAPVDELRYIYEHSDSAGIAVLQGPKLLQKLLKSSSQSSSSKSSSATSKNSKLGLSNPTYGPVQTIVLMHREKWSQNDIAQLAADCQVTVHVFDDLVQAAVPLPVHQQPTLSRSDLATIVYTSGTTGNPKGVMLTHGNLLHQTGHRLAPTRPYQETEPLPGETMVSILPVWHITERTFELWMAARGCSIVYSSIRTFKKDLAVHQPQWMVLVPRVLEKIAAGIQDKFASGSAAVKILSKFFTKVSMVHAKHSKTAKGLVVANEAVSGMDEITSKVVATLIKPVHAIGNKLVWSKVRDGFGGRLKVIISGGSALAGSLESFYEAAGMTILVGYGLTECSPLISFRRRDANLVTAGCAGTACEATEFRVVDPTINVNGLARPRTSLPNGETGLILAKGPQVMRGYYKNKEATDKAIDSFGWFDTGDLGFVNTLTGDLILTGRAKDTIVLSNGENVEPVPIEDAIVGVGKPLVDQVMLTGQDGRSLLAIVVLNPIELASRGFLDESRSKALQEAMEKINDPKCSTVDCDSNCQLLVDASRQLRLNADLQKAVGSIMKQATMDGFRPWEKVNDFYLTLEPFAMSNGQLTQSYKVKRAQVLQRYAKELPQ